MKPRRRLFATRVSLPFVTAIAALFAASHGQAQTTILWNTTPVASVANGAWGNTANWVGGNIPDTDTEIASLSRDWTGTSGTHPSFSLGADRTVNGVIYEDAGASGDLAGIINAGNTLTLSGATPTITTTNSLTINSIVSWGASGLTKIGAGTLTLNGANTGTGGVTVSAGVLNIRNATALGTVAGGTTVASGAALEIQGGITVGAEALSLNGSGISNGGALRNISGTNSYGGSVTLAGATRISSDAGLLTLDVASGSAITGTQNLTFAGAGNITVADPIATGTGTLTKTGTGTLTLTAANTYSGTTTIGTNAANVGTVDITNGSALGTGAVSMVSNAGSSNFAALTLNSGSGITVANNFTTSGEGQGGNGIIRNVTGTNVISGTLTLASGGGSTRIHSDSGSLTLSGNVSTNTTGRFLILGGSATGTVSGNIVNGSGSNTLSGVTKQGTGTWTLSGANNYSGTTTISNGVLRAASATALGGNSTPVTVASGAALDVGATMSGTNALTLNGTGVTAAPAGALTSSITAGTYVGAITLGSNATIGGGASALTLGSTATVDIGANTLTMSTSGARTVTNGVFSGTGAVAATGANAPGVGGDWASSAAHTYSGGTTLNAGSNVIPGASSIGVGAGVTSGPFGTGPLTLAGAAMRSGTGGPFTVGNTVTLSADTTFYTVGSEKTLIFAGPVTMTGASRTLTSTVGTTVAGTTVLFTDAIGDGGNALGLTKAGAGNLTLGGLNTYTGGTVVNAGTLVLSGSLPSATALTVSPTVPEGAAFTLASGAANPLTTVSALTLGSATGPATLGFDLANNTAASDFITTTSAATTTGTVNLSIHAIAGFGAASTYDLISAPGGLGGATYALTSAPGGYTYSLTTSGTLVTLNVNPTTAGDLYWRGDAGNSWSAFSGSNSNWYSNGAGTTNAQANPAGGDTVNFSTVNAVTSGGTITTTLDNNFTVNDLVFGSDPNGVNSVTIAGGVAPGAVPGVLTIAPGASGDGVNVGSNAGNVTISAPVLLGAAQTWSVDGTGVNGSALNVSGALGGTAALAINGLVTLSAPGTSTHNGTITVPSGSILQGGATNSFSASSALVVNGTGVVRLNGSNNRAATITGTGILQNNHASTGATLTVGDAGNFTFAGTLQNGAGGALGLTKAGSGVMTLTGTNTHTGTTTVNDGTLKSGSATTFGTAGLGSGPLALAGTGVFDLNGFNAAVTNVSASVAGATITNSGASDATLAISAQANTIASLLADGGTNNLAVTLRNNNGGTTPFTLSTTNTFSGGVTLVDGTALGAGTRLTINGAITGAPFGTGPITVGQSATDKAGIFFSSATTLANDLVINTAQGTDRVGIRADVAATLSGKITANLAPVTFTSNNATAGNFTVTGQVTGASGLVLDITSLSAAATSFNVTLNNAGTPNNYAGDTIVNLNAATGKSATLTLGAANQIPNGTGTGNVVLNTNGTGVGRLALSGFDETINGLSGNGTVDGATTGTPTNNLTLGDNNATATFSGVIQNTAGTLSVTKIGSGTQTLGGASTFTGPLTVNGGVVAFASSPATSGPLGNSTVVNLSGGGISYTDTSASSLNRSVAIGAANGTLDMASSAGALTISSVTSAGGDLVKTGPGTAIISGTTTLNGGAADVDIDAGTLRAGFGTGGVATLSVGATGNLDQRNSATEALVLDGVSGALALDGGAQLGFELSGAANDSIAVDAGGTASTTGTVTLNFFGTPTATTYTLLTAPGGLNGATYVLGAAPSGFNYTINATANAVTLTVTTESPIYWRDGQTDGQWTTLGSGPANWTTDAAGAIDATSTPAAVDAVILSATGGTAASNVGAAFTVDSLRFANSHTITASGPGALTLAPASTSGGIRVLGGSLTASISAPLTIGAAQTWDVDASGSLAISGNTTFTGSVTKTNGGVLTLSGTNGGAGAFTLAGGTLNLNSANALGSGLFTIGAGTTLNTPSGAIALAGNNAQNWNGDFTFTGANTLDLGTGAVTLGNSLTVSTPGSTLTVGGIIGDGGNNRGITKAGSGTLLLNGANTYGGLTTISAGALRITNGAALGTTTGGTTQSGTSALELDGTGGDITVGAEALTINGVGISSGGALRNIAGNNTFGGTVTMAAQSRINSDSGTLTLSNPAAVSATNLTLLVGGAGNTTISGAIATGTGGVNKADGAGTLTLSGANTYQGATTVTAGTLTLTSGGSITTAGNILLNINGAATANIAGSYTSTGGGGVAINTGGVLNTSGTVSISGPNNTAILLGTSGGSGTWNVTGGSVSVNYVSNGWGLGNGGLGTLNVSGGSVTTAATNVFNVGHAANGTGVLTISGTGLVTINPGSGAFSMGANATSTGIVNLNGGTLALGRNVTKNASATSTFNFNGGVLGVGLTSTTYLQNLTRANVRDGGAWIDTNGFNVTIGQALLHSDIGGDAAIDGGLTKSDLGTLTLTGANTYTGPTLVSGGTLQLNGSAAAGPLTTGSMTVGAAGTLGFTAGSASTLDLTGKDMTLGGGTLNFDISDPGSNDKIDVNNFTLTANSAFTFNSIGAIGGSYTLVTSANPISNAGSYTISGQTIGRVTLTPTVNTNTITVNSTVFEGKWNLTTGGNWSLGDPNMTQDNWLNYKPTVAGDAALFGDTITAPSTVLVDTPHIVGYLRFDNANAYTIGASGSSNLTLNNGTSNAVATVTSGSHTIAENVALLSSLDLLPATSSTLAISGIVSGASTRAVEVAAPGTVVLSGANTYTGTTTVSNGTLTLSGNRTATSGGMIVGNTTGVTGTLNVTNGTFTVGGTGSAFMVGSGTGGIGVMNQSGGSLTTSANQLLIGNGTGTGTYNLSGGTLNTVAGALGVTVGVNTGATATFNLSGTGTLAMPTNSTLQITRSDNSGASGVTGTFNQTGGTATVGILQMGGSATTPANNADGNATLNLTGGTFSANTFNVLSGANNSTSTINIGGSAEVTLPAFPTNVKGSGATATITFDSTTGFLSPAAASATYLPAGTFTDAYLTANGANFNVPAGRDITIAQVLEDAVSPAAVGTLTKSGVGVLTLSGANLYTGVTTVSDGTINLGVVDALGTAAGGTTVAGGARVNFGALATASTVAEPFDIAGDGTSSNGVLNVGGNKTINLSGPITLSADARITADGGSAFNLTNVAAVTATDKNLTFHTDGSAASSITGAISLGTGSLTKSSTSTLTLSGSNSYSGGTVLSGGVIQANNNSALGNGTVVITGTRLSVGSGVTLANPITINANTGVTGRGVIEASAGTAVLTGPITINNGAPAGGLLASVGAAVLDIQGVITSSVEVTSRTGTVKFSGGGTGYTNLGIGQGTVMVGANNGIATTASVSIGNSAAGNLDLNGFNQSLAGIAKGGFGAIIGNSSTTADSVLTTTGTCSFAGIIQNTLGAGTRKLGLVVDSGTLTLTAANTYTGDTVVNAAGTFVLADNAQVRFVLGNTSGDSNDLTGAGTATLDGDFVIDTTAADTLATGSWTLENVTTLTGGAYGTTFSVVGFTDIGGNKWEKTVSPTKKYTFDEATGILTLGPSASYSSWIASFGLTGGDALAGSDPDFDGIPNAVEMVLGGNPATGMDTALLPTIELVTDPTGTGPIPAGDYLLFTYRRSDLSVTAGVTADCQTDTDLVAPWTSATGAPGVVIQVDDNFTFSPPAAANTDRVRVYVPRGANTKLFGRLDVEVP